MFKTIITNLFGIKYPIIRGRMMWISWAELVAAVSNNAGPLDILTAFTLSTFAEPASAECLADHPPSMLNWCKDK